MEPGDRDNVAELEIHREALCNQINVRRILDKTRSRGVFTKDEYEEIMNEVLNPTAIRKAGCFLDNLQRKGRDGFNVFLECLGEIHPNVYQLLTGIEPEAPINQPNMVVYACPVPRLRYGNVIEDLYQEVEDLQRELGFLNQLKLEHEREIKHLNQCLKTANIKAERCEKIGKAKRRAESKVKVLEGEIINLLGNSLLHKQEKDDAVENLAQKRKEVNELERCLREAQNHAEFRRQIWHKTCLDKQQLKVDREEILQKMSSMEEELKQVKRKEDVRNSMIISEDCHVDQFTQAKLNIYRDELESYKKKCEELASTLLASRNDIHCKDTDLEKCKSENVELKQKMQSAQKLADTFKKHYNITWQELNRVKQERLRANDERDLAQIESKHHLKQLHSFQETIYGDLQSLQSTEVGSTQQYESVGVDENRNGSNDSKSQQERSSFHSSTSGVSTQTQSDTEPMTVKMDVHVEDNNAVLPDDGREPPLHSPDSLTPFTRGRCHNIASSRRVVITDEVRAKVGKEDTFPHEFFSFTPSPEVEVLHGMNPWLNRHHSESLGDSRRVNIGSIKSRYYTSLFDKSDSEDPDEHLSSLDDDDDDDDNKDAAVTTTTETHPHPHQRRRRSRSVNNLI